jgi:hypothetical protein
MVRDSSRESLQTCGNPGRLTHTTSNGKVKRLVGIAITLTDAVVDPASVPSLPTSAVNVVYAVS